LNDYGLQICLLETPIGSASALKMAYAGISKGLTAVASSMILAATRDGVAGQLQRELAASEPLLLASLARRIPDMLPKAYRWVEEMEQIRQFAAADPAAAEIYAGAGKLYERIAAVFPARSWRSLRSTLFCPSPRAIPANEHRLNVVSSWREREARMYGVDFAIGA